jgi:group I intron endonuclease
MGCGIYKIENIVDKKIYIGSSVNVESREYKHFWMLKRKSHDNNHLQNAYNKFGKDSFKFQIIEECGDDNLIIRENFYIDFYKSNISEFGYNLATVNEFRRNTFNDEVKQKLSKYNLIKNGNFNTFSLTNIKTNDIFIFETLVDGANYLISNGFANGNPRTIRMKISMCLRGIKVNAGSNYKCVRKTCYKHNFNIIN